MNIQQIRTHLDRIIAYLAPFESFYNCHMVNYLTDNHWNNFISQNIRNSIKSTKDIDEAIKDIWWCRNQNTKFQDLLKFIEETETYYLDNLNITPTLENIFGENNIFELTSIKEFMSEKKRHEVEIMAKTVKYLINKQNERDFVIVDAGDGKGYLSSRLSLEYDIKVLGIDSNEMNTINAQKRNEKLQRAWNALTKRAELINQGLRPTASRKKPSKPIYNKENSLNKNNNYKTINEFITTDLCLKHLINDIFNLNNKSISICLTGLHTCGNLASTCLKVFNAQNSIKILCNVGCCYHLLKEEFSANENYINSDVILKNIDYGFPLSQHLKNLQYKIGRNARMLASQSISRISATKELSHESLYYRALLEILIVQYKPELKNKIHVGKIKKFTTFNNYLEKCDKKLQIDLKSIIIDENHLDLLMKKYEMDRKLLDLFYLIRMSFSLVLETLILLDRLLYLKENGFEKSYLIKLFDPIVSPRCYGIIAIKE